MPKACRWFRPTTIGIIVVAYRYYASVPSPKTALDVIRRVRAKGIEDLVVDRCRRLFGSEEPPIWSDLTPLLTRVEIRASSVHLCCRRESLFREGESRDELISRLREAIPVGDSIYLEDAAVRLVCARRPVFCDGRKWKETPPGVKGPVHNPNAPALVALLRKAHQELSPPSATIELSCDHGITYQITQRKRRLLAVTLLAPDIQRAILTGVVPGRLAVADLIEAELPVSWEDQRHVLGFA